MRHFFFTLLFFFADGCRGSVTFGWVFLLFAEVSFVAVAVDVEDVDVEEEEYDDEDDSDMEDIIVDDSEIDDFRINAIQEYMDKYPESTSNRSFSLLWQVIWNLLQ